MGQKLSPADLALYRAVDEILHYVWDPIGISDTPEMRDEYHGYVPQVFGLLRNGGDEEAIASYLGKVVSERMGLSINAEHDKKIARLLLDWKEFLDDQHA